MAHDLLGPTRTAGTIRTVPSLATRAVQVARTREAALIGSLTSWRRRSLVLRVRLLAAWHHAAVDIAIDRGVRLGRGIRATIDPGTTTSLRIAAGSVLGDRVLLRLKGGSLEIGEGCDIRRDVVMSVGGRLVLEGDNVISWATLLHCDEQIVIRRHAMVAEYATVVDSSHFYTEPDVAPHRNVRTSPVEIGIGSWLCPKATVTSGVRIGDHVIVASNSVVIGDVAGGQLVSGVPASVVRPLDLPWKSGPQAGAVAGGERSGG
jgi:acetyltransferase-like isoleucine patch superfamily enzyme